MDCYPNVDTRKLKPDLDAEDKMLSMIYTYQHFMNYEAAVTIQKWRCGNVAWQRCQKVNDEFLLVADVLSLIFNGLMNEMWSASDEDEEESEEE